MIVGRVLSGARSSPVSDELFDRFPRVFVTMEHSFARLIDGLFSVILLALASMEGLRSSEEDP